MRQKRSAADLVLAIRSESLKAGLASSFREHYSPLPENSISGCYVELCITAKQGQYGDGIVQRKHICYV